MAIYTQLSPSALPGRRYSFAAKDAAPVGGPHTGNFTELAVNGLPGKRHSFSAKDPATGAGPHTGLFTELGVNALPGQRHSFSAKTAAEVVTPTPTPTPTAPSGGIPTLHLDRKDGRRKKDLWREKILKDDEELLELAGIIVSLGLLD